MCRAERLTLPIVLLPEGSQRSGGSLPENGLDRKAISSTPGTFWRSHADWGSHATRCHPRYPAPDFDLPQSSRLPQLIGSFAACATWHRP